MLKSCWITEFGENYTLSLESSNVDNPISSDTVEFPDRETGETRSTMSIGLFNFSDLLKLYRILGDYLEEQDMENRI